MRRPAFTLIELIVVVGILGLLAALVFPVVARIREAPRQTTCLSNMRQLGSACRLYLSDWDETYPLLWWAGATYPYVNQTVVYRCPDDDNLVRLDGGKKAYPLSYSRNYNFLDQFHDAQLTSPTETVLLFEVTGINVQLQDPTEGVRSDKIGPQQFSGGGNGVDCDLVTTGPTTHDPFPTVSYETGVMDNARSADDCTPSQYDRPGRHQYGSNFIAADTHSKWLRAARVSAGYNALSTKADQSHTGCKYHGTPPTPNQPCAAGTQNSKHTLTFSVN